MLIVRLVLFVFIMLRAAIPRLFFARVSSVSSLSTPPPPPSSSYGAAAAGWAFRPSFSFSTSSLSSTPSSRLSGTFVRPFHAPVFLTTVAAVISFRPLTTFADAPRYGRRSSSTSASGGGGAAAAATEGDDDDDDDDERQDDGGGGVAATDEKKRKEKCPFYGCPLLPTDVHYTSDEVKTALQSIRDMKREDVVASSSSESESESSSSSSSESSSKEDGGDPMEVLESSGRADAATLTLIGYKGGQLTEQINQDRALVVSPFYLPDDDDEEDDGGEADDNNDEKTRTRRRKGGGGETESAALSAKRILLGVFDGHAPLGEKVSEYTRRELPKLLATKLRDALRDVGVQDGDDQDEEDGSKEDAADEDEVVRVTRRALNETFVELDRTAPAEESGGCTATIVLRQGNKIYVANAGDSRSLLALYRPSTGRTEVFFVSREDKPDLPDEKSRVKSMGGEVYIPIRGTSRVVYHDPKTGSPTGLAMSRSIGDWAAGKLGVIPDPVVTVFDMRAVISDELSHSVEECFVVDENGDVTPGTDAEGCASPAVDDVHIFAVSATDGMMDYLTASEVATAVAHSLYDGAGRHPLTTCEKLIFAAANYWQMAKRGMYRDDIAIAVSTLRTPPPSQPTDGETSGN